MPAIDFSLDDFLPYRLSVAANAVSVRIAKVYRTRFGLKVAEWRVLAVLAEHPRMTPAMLGEATRMDKISVSRAAKALVDRGLVATEAHATDRRSHFLSLTGAGRELYAVIVPLAVATERTLLAAMGADEIASLASMLRRIETVASDD